MKRSAKVRLAESKTTNSGQSGEIVIRINRAASLSASRRSADRFIADRFSATRTLATRFLAESAPADFYKHSSINQ